MLVAPGLVLAAGAWWWTTQEPDLFGPPAGSSTSGAAAEVVPRSRLPEAAPAPRTPGAPVRLGIPALDVDVPVDSILAPGGVLTPPSDPQTLGWWADGARPGDPRGSALVTGHTVSTGGGALDDLETLDPGDGIRVRSANTSTSYAVETVEIYAKGDLAERAEALFDQSVPGRLVVVTCEDWDGDEYLSNVVVTAAPTRPR